MIECDHCGVEFEVELEGSYQEAEILYCPCCGERLITELDFDDE